MYIYARIFLDFVWELEVGVKFSKLDFVEDLYPTETIIFIFWHLILLSLEVCARRGGSYCG